MKIVSKEKRIPKLTFSRINEVEAWEKRPLNEKIELANQVIKLALSQSKRPSIAFSGGKNSLVLLHLVLQYSPDVYVSFNNTKIEYPETVKFVRKLAKEWDLNFHEIKPVTNYWSILKVYGIQDRPRRWGRWYKEPECCKLLKTGPVADFYNENKIDCYFTGISAFESRARKLTIASFGLLRESVKKVGQRGHLNKPATAAYPVALFTEYDIWKYIEEHELPVNPAYEKYGISRTGCMYCLNYIGADRYLAINHPRMYRKILKISGQSQLEDYKWFFHFFISSTKFSITSINSSA